MPEGCLRYRSHSSDPSKLDHTDVRFNRNGERLFATVLGVPPSGVVQVKSLSSNTSVSDANNIKSVKLLEHGAVKWKRSAEGRSIELPSKLPNEWALVFELGVQGELDKAKPAYDEKWITLPKQT